MKGGQFNVILVKISEDEGSFIQNGEALVKQVEGKCDVLPIGVFEIRDRGFYVMVEETSCVKQYAVGHDTMTTDEFDAICESNPNLVAEVSFLHPEKAGTNSGSGSGCTLF